MSASHPCWPRTLAWRQAGTRREGAPSTSHPGICVPHLIPALGPGTPQRCLQQPAERSHTRTQTGTWPSTEELHFRAVCPKHRISVPGCVSMFPYLSSSPLNSILFLSLLVSVLLFLSLSDPTLTPTPSLSFKSPPSGPSTCSGNLSSPWPRVSIEPLLVRGVRTWRWDRYVGGPGSAVLAS